MSVYIGRSSLQLYELFSELCSPNDRDERATLLGFGTAPIGLKLHRLFQVYADQITNVPAVARAFIITRLVLEAIKLGASVRSLDIHPTPELTRVDDVSVKSDERAILSVVTNIFLSLSTLDLFIAKSVLDYPYPILCDLCIESLSKCNDSPRISALIRRLDPPTEHIDLLVVYSMLLLPMRSHLLEHVETEGRKLSIIWGNEKRILSMRRGNLNEADIDLEQKQDITIEPYYPAKLFSDFDDTVQARLYDNSFPYGTTYPGYIPFVRCMRANFVPILASSLRYATRVDDYAESLSIDGYTVDDKRNSPVKEQLVSTCLPFHRMDGILTKSPSKPFGISRKSINSPTMGKVAGVGINSGQVPHSTILEQVLEPFLPISPLSPTFSSSPALHLVSSPIEPRNGSENRVSDFSSCFPLLLRFLSVDLTFLSARPSFLRAQTRQMAAALRIPHAGVLCGSISAALTRGRMAAMKLRNFRNHAGLFPECRVVFVGDSGQADADFAALMLSLSVPHVSSPFGIKSSRSPPSRLEGAAEGTTVSSPGNLKSPGGIASETEHSVTSPVPVTSLIARSSLVKLEKIPPNKSIVSNGKTNVNPVMTAPYSVSPTSESPPAADIANEIDFVKEVGKIPQLMPEEPLLLSLSSFLSGHAAIHPSPDGATSPTPHLAESGAQNSENNNILRCSLLKISSVSTSSQSSFGSSSVAVSQSIPSPLTAGDVLSPSVSSDSSASHVTFSSQQELVLRLGPADVSNMYVTNVRRSFDTYPNFLGPSDVNQEYRGRVVVHGQSWRHLGRTFKKLIAGPKGRSPQKSKTDSDQCNDPYLASLNPSNIVDSQAVGLNLNPREEVTLLDVDEADNDFVAQGEVVEKIEPLAEAPEVEVAVAEAEAEADERLIAAVGERLLHSDNSSVGFTPSPEQVEGVEEVEQEIENSLSNDIKLDGNLDFLNPLKVPTSVLKTGETGSVTPTSSPSYASGPSADQFLSPSVELSISTKTPMDTAAPEPLGQSHVVSLLRDHPPMPLAMIHDICGTSQLPHTRAAHRAAQSPKGINFFDSYLEAILSLYICSPRVISRDVLVAAAFATLTELQSVSGWKGESVENTNTNTILSKKSKTLTDIASIASVSNVATLPTPSTSQKDSISSSKPTNKVKPFGSAVRGNPISSAHPQDDCNVTSEGLHTPVKANRPMLPSSSLNHTTEEPLNVTIERMGRQRSRRYWEFVSSLRAVRAVFQTERIALAEQLRSLELSSEDDRLLSSMNSLQMEFNSLENDIALILSIENSKLFYFAQDMDTSGFESALRGSGKHKMLS